VQVYRATTKEFKCAFKSAGYMPTKKTKVATCTYGKCRKGFRNAGKVLKMQERF
jgi:hypothetical protein